MGTVIDEEGHPFELTPDKVSKDDDGKVTKEYIYCRDDKGEDCDNYINHKIVYYERGRIVYYGNNYKMCTSGVLIPGTALLPIGLLTVCYFLTMIYLFLGISIISDIFMSGIEKITSQTVTVEIKDMNNQVVRKKKILFWNATVANLTLMALGSSAPEIILALFETIDNMDGCPGELGASTIVGSAAFNLLVISGVSIYAVDESNDDHPERDENLTKGVKKIADMRVFSITATSSIFAYVWMLIVLLDQNVSVVEAWLTFAFFFVLIGAAFGADRYTQSQEENNKLISGEKEEKLEVFEFSAMEIYRELVREK